MDQSQLALCPRLSWRLQSCYTSAQMAVAVLLHRLKAAQECAATRQRNESPLPPRLTFTSPMPRFQWRLWPDGRVLQEQLLCRGGC